MNQFTFPLAAYTCSNFHVFRSICHYLFHSSHPGHCEVACRCGFDLHVLDEERQLASFHKLLAGQLYSCFIYSSLWEECVLQSCAHLLIGLSFLLLGCKCSLYVPDISLLPEIRCINIFSHPVGFLFHFPGVHNVLNLIKSSVAIFFFCCSSF